MISGSPTLGKGSASVGCQPQVFSGDGDPLELREIRRHPRAGKQHRRGARRTGQAADDVQADGQAVIGKGDLGKHGIENHGAEFRCLKPADRSPAPALTRSDSD